MKSYFSEAYARVKDNLKVSNLHDVPCITQVAVNVGVGKKEPSDRQAIFNDLKLITGQAPQERKARQAVAGFKVRQGDLVGYRVTLRGKRMADFVERFVKITLPRVRDFRGIALKAMDGRGNLNVGLSEQMSFPEIRADKTDVLFGLQVTFVTSAQTNEEGEEIFRALGFPLADKA